MWGYYGSKSKIIGKYPSPRLNKIIEPFAGTAQYSLKYYDRQVLLVDKCDIIIKIWKWLQICSKQDILKLPRLKYGENLDNFNWDCEEAKFLMGFIINSGSAQPKKTASWRVTIHRPNTQNYKLNLIADSLHKIKHWEIRQGCYTELNNEEATYFVDPPYKFGGKYYKHNNIDYNYLSEWCKNRNGQIIVCENSKADWMEFKPLVEMRGQRFNTTECMFYRK